MEILTFTRIQNGCCWYSIPVLMFPVYRCVIRHRVAHALLLTPGLSQQACNDQIGQLTHSVKQCIGSWRARGGTAEQESQPGEQIRQAGCSGPGQPGSAGGLCSLPFLRLSPALWHSVGFLKFPS